MTYPSPRPSRSAIEELRASVAAATAEASARSVARQVGMSAAGLLKFVGGTTPTPPTYRKLRAWYERRPQPSDDEAEP